MERLHVDDSDSTSGPREPLEDDLDRMRERMAEQPAIDARSDQIAANAGLPGEADHRDQGSSITAGEEGRGQEI